MDPDPDTDPGTPLNMDPIRIRTVIHNTGLKYVNKKKMRQIIFGVFYMERRTEAFSFQTSLKYSVMKNYVFSQKFVAFGIHTFSLRFIIVFFFFL